LTLALAVLIAAVAAYVVSSEQANEAKARIAALEKQLHDKDLADAARQRAAQQQLEDTARQRRELEQQAQAAQERSQAEAAARRNADERSKSERAPPAAPRITETKRPDEPVRPPAPVVRAAPSIVAPAPPAPVPVVEPAASRASDAAPKAATLEPEPARSIPVKVPAEQLADADRAIEAQRFAEALAILRPLADAGNARAQTRLGDAYMQGQGIPRDDAAAGRWYEKAALQGETGAQVKLAAMYVNGNGVLRNNNLAYVWYGTAARLGSGPAKIEQEKLGVLLQPAERAQADKLIDSTATRMAKRP
jgi:hypothetical protein